MEFGKFLDAAAGVQSDCDRLMKRFVDTNNIRYEQFAEIWRDMKMPFIFYGKEFERELIEFTDSALHIAKTYWVNKNDVQTQIGGLYLLYGFYLKQPNRIKRKIRVTIDDWNTCANFVSYIVENNHWDTLHVFRELIILNAFLYVHIPTEIYPESLSQRRLSREKPYQVKVAKELSSYFDEVCLGELGTCHDRYFEAKNELSRDQSSFGLSDKDAFNKIMRVVNSLVVCNPGRAGGGHGDSPDEEEEDDESSEEEFGDIGSRRAQLKHKIFLSGLKLAHHLPQAQVVTQFPSTSSKPPAATKRRRNCRTASSKFTSDTEDSSDGESGCRLVMVDPRLPSLDLGDGVGLPDSAAPQACNPVSPTIPDKVRRGRPRKNKSPAGKKVSFVEDSPSPGKSPATGKRPGAAAKSSRGASKSLDLAPGPSGASLKRHTPSSDEAIIKETRKRKAKSQNPSDVTADAVEAGRPGRVGMGGSNVGRKRRKK